MRPSSLGMPGNENELEVYFPIRHYCPYCGTMHYGLCPNSMGRAIDTIYERLDELQAQIEYLNNKINRLSSRGAKGKSRKRK